MNSMDKGENMPDQPVVSPTKVDAGSNRVKEYIFVIKFSEVSFPVKTNTNCLK